MYVSKLVTVSFTVHKFSLCSQRTAHKTEVNNRSLLGLAYFIRHACAWMRYWVLLGQIRTVRRACLQLPDRDSSYYCPVLSQIFLAKCAPSVRGFISFGQEDVTTKKQRDSFQSTCRWLTRHAPPAWLKFNDVKGEGHTKHPSKKKIEVLGTYLLHP